MKPHNIDVSRILEHPGDQFVFSGPVSLEPAKLGAELIDFPVPSELNVTLTSVNRGIVVNGTAVGRLRLRCARCLETFDYEVTFNIEELAVADGSETKDEVFAVEDGNVDLAAIVYQNLMPAVPIRPLCRDDCAGLCSDCGKNLNDEPHSHPSDDGDERLSALKKYFNQK